VIDLSSNYNKNIRVYYDSLFRLQKISRHDILTIYKLDFDYDTGEINQKNIPLEIDFGDSGATILSNATKSCYVDSILLEKEKAVLICGLQWISANKEQLIDSQWHVGDVYNPIFYKYDINSHTLKKLYPSSEELTQWQSFLQGDKVSSQIPLVSFDPANNRLGYIFKTTRTIDGQTQRNYVDIDFIYRTDSLELENVRILSAENSNGDYNSTIFWQKYVNHDDQKILIAAGSKSLKKRILMMRLKPSVNTEIVPDIYLLTEDGFRLTTEDGEYLTI
jgi:hypothetical protein